MGKFGQWFRDSSPNLGGSPNLRSVTAPTLVDIPRAFQVGPTYAPTVSVNEALGSATVYRCVSIIANLGSSLDIEATRANKPLINQPALVRKPNINQPRRVSIYETITALALYGETFWYLTTSPDGGPVTGIEVLANTQVAVLRQPDNSIRYRVTWIGKPATEYGSDKIQQLKLMHVAGALHGLGPIQAAASALRGALDLEDYAGNWWNRNEIPEGILTTDETIGPDQAKRQSDEWAKARRERRTAVLGNGLKYQPIVPSPKDILWLEASQFNTVQIARMFGVPATMLDAPSGDSAVYANQEQKNQALLSQTLRQYLDEIEDALSEILPLGTSARFQTDELLRLDELTRAKADAILVGADLRTPNELRARDGLDALEQKPIFPDTFNGIPKPRKNQLGAPTGEGNDYTNF